MCGKRLAVLIRMNIDILYDEKELGIEADVREKLIRISPATIDRMLVSDRRKLALNGRSHTRAGIFLKHQIPIRVFYDWDERKPGFFELDTVAHDGGVSSGEYCFTLNATDVYSGWVELGPLQNRAHRWVKEQTEGIREELPFLLIRTVSYYRFDTKQESETLGEVYRYLCPLLNFYYPSVRIIEKIIIGAWVKKIYDEPKPPYVRLLKSADIEVSVKEELRGRAAKIHVVKQKRLFDKAVAKPMRIYEQKVQGHLPFEQ